MARFSSSCRDLPSSKAHQRIRQDVIELHTSSHLWLPHLHRKYCVLRSNLEEPILAPEQLPPSLRDGGLPGTRRLVLVYVMHNLLPAEMRPSMSEGTGSHLSSLSSSMAAPRSRPSRSFGTSSPVGMYQVWGLKDLRLLEGWESSQPDGRDLVSVRPASLTLISALPSPGSPQKGDAPDSSLVEGLLGPSQWTGEVMVEKRHLFEYHGPPPLSVVNRSTVSL